MGLHYLAILLIYKWLIVGITALATVGVVAFSIWSLLLPPEESPLPNYYDAYATLLVSQDTGLGSSSMMLSALGIDVPGGSGMDYGQVAQQVMQSRGFLDMIVDEFDLIERYNVETEIRSKSRELVRTQMTIEYIPQTGVLMVGYTDIDPEFARDVANSIVEHLQEWFRARGGLTRLRELEASEARIREVEEEISRLESEILAFQRQHGVVNVEEIAQSQATMIADLQSQLVELEVQIRSQEMFSRIQDDPALARLRAERANVIDLINQIEAGYTGGVRRNPSRSELPEIALEFRRLQTDLDIQLRIYQTVAQQYEVGRLNAESEPAFTVLEYAETPDRKAGPSRGRLSITVTMGAFGGGIALAFLLHYLRENRLSRRLREEIDVVSGKD